MAKIRVLLADDHTLFREGVRLLLEDTGDVEVVGQAADGEEAVELAREIESKAGDSLSFKVKNKRKLKRLGRVLKALQGGGG